MKKKLFLIGAVVASIVVSACSAAGCSDKKEWVEELPNTFINQTLDFELTPEVEMPTPDVSSHRGEEIENLVVKYGQSYENDEYLKDDVVLFRRWQWEALYNSLTQKAKANPRYLNTYRLQAEAYLIKSEYQAALAALDKVLSYNHDDVYALGLSAYVQNIQGNTAQRDARLKALKKVSPKCHDDLYGLMEKVTGWIAEEHGTDKLNDNEKRDYDAIGLLGVSPTSDGKLQGSGAARVKAAFKAAYMSRDDQNNSPKIIPSGGAIDTEYSEAKVMGDYLVRNSTAIAESLKIDPAEFCVYGDDVILDEQARDTVGNIIGICSIMQENDLHNLLVIASENQVMRAECIVKAYVDARGYDITVSSHSCGGDSASANQTKYSYICAASAYGLFTKEDFAAHSKYTVETTNVLTRMKGEVKLDKTTADKGETVSYSVVTAAGFKLDGLEVKTVSGKPVTVNSGTFVMPDESVIINAKFSRLEGTVTLNFFNEETFGTNENGITDIAKALSACEKDAKTVTDNLISVTDTIGDDPLSNAKNALGYGKMGGFGLAAGGRIGGFKLTFKEDFKINKIQVTAVKFAENEGQLQVNGIDPTSGTLKGEANTLDYTSVIEYSFAEAANVFDFRTAADTVDGSVNYGRVIIYSITIFTEDATKADKVYSVNINSCENGEIYSDIQDAIAGTEITLSAKGEPHYFLDKYTVKQGDTEITVTDGKFIMPAGDVTVSGTFVNRLVATAEMKVQGDKKYHNEIVGDVVFDKEAYMQGDEAVITVKVGAGFEIESLVAKSAQGQTVELTKKSDGTYKFTFPNDDVAVTVTYKVKANTTTLDFIIPEYVGTGEHGSYTAADIQSGYQERLNAVFGAGYVTVSNVDACGIDKFGGWGIGSGSKPGSFTLDFGDKKISEIVVNGAKNKDGEGKLTVNGVSATDEFTVVNGGAGGKFDIDSNVSFEFETPTNVLDFSGLAKATGRSIIYSITIVWAE